MGRGRPRKTDPEAALDTSMAMFWEKGFEGTSMNDLAVATGMAKPGLYANFGDKESLYKKALTRYVKELGGPLLDDLTLSTDPLDVVIRRYLETVAASNLDETCPGGCFFVNSVIDCAHGPASLEKLTREFEASRRAAFVERFRASKNKGELPDDADPEALGEFFAGQVLALAVMALAGADRESLDRFIDVAMTVLPGNRTSA